MRNIVSFLLLILAGTFPAFSQASYLQNPDVKAFIDTFISKHGGSRSELEQLLQIAQQQTQVLEAIARPAEKTHTWATYRPIFIQSNRITQGVDFWNQNQAILSKAEKQFGVPPAIIVGIIGVETFYGRFTGKHPVFNSLTTLAFDYPPRSAFFRRQLEEFLLLSREESIQPTTVTGSYAGAMGIPQFIPSSYRHYAIDFNKDGRRDLLSNMDDVIGSVANYFSRHGWQKDKPVAEQLQIQDERYKLLIKKSLKPTITDTQLTAAGLQTHSASSTYTVMELAGTTGPELWIGHPNFYVITRYNHSHLYAMAVYQLGQAISKERAQTAR